MLQYWHHNSGLLWYVKRNIPFYAFSISSTLCAERLTEAGFDSPLFFLDLLWQTVTFDFFEPTVIFMTKTLPLDLLQPETSIYVIFYGYSSIGDKTRPGCFRAYIKFPLPCVGHHVLLSQSIHLSSFFTMCTLCCRHYCWNSLYHWASLCIFYSRPHFL